MMNTLHPHFGKVMRLYIPHLGQINGSFRIFDNTSKSFNDFFTSHLYLSSMNKLIAIYENFSRYVVAPYIAIYATYEHDLKFDVSAAHDLFRRIALWTVKTYVLSIPSIIFRNLFFYPAWTLNQHNMDNIVQCFNADTHQLKVENKLNGKK